MYAIASLKLFESKLPLTAVIVASLLEFECASFKNQGSEICAHCSLQSSSSSVILESVSINCQSINADARLESCLDFDWATLIHE